MQRFITLFLGTFMKRKPLILTAIILTVTPISLLAEEPTILPTITIEGEQLSEPGISQQNTEDILGTPADAGDFLRGIPGVSGTRMGGHGIDPIIRGQSQNRLNILLDGAYVHGACPNRMDPPTAYSSVETYDSVTVIKGSQTVIYGGGGSGGTVLFERKTPHFTEDKFAHRSKISTGYTTNSETKDLLADIAVGSTQGFARGIVKYQDAENYKDGDGNETRSAFTTQTGNLIFGYTPDDKTLFELGLEANRIEDVLYSGAGMDSPSADNNTIRLKYEKKGETKAEFYYSDVEHVMDNFSQRPITAPMKMLVDSESKTQGLRISHDFVTNDEKEWTVGFDYQKNDRDANRFAGPASVSTPTNIQSIMWPDVELKQMGIFSELLMPFDADLVKVGLRFDRISSQAGRLNQATMGGIRPVDLYNSYYGKSAGDDENNIGGFIRYERELRQAEGFAFISLSRSIRTADATERFLAANNNNTAERWIGNPNLDPEQHHQLELGLSRQFDYWDVSTSVFYNYVSDYILRDRAHAQSGILQNDNATIYRNINAQLLGFEWETNVKWNQQWLSRFTMDFVHATNTIDDRPIAQTPPLSGTFSLDYKQAKSLLGGNLRMAIKQTQIDNDINTGSGLDAGKTSGFGVLDFYGSVNLSNRTAVKFGINNVFDSSYAYHVNRANVDPFNSEPVQVNEPGRAFWVKFSAEF